MGSSQTVFYVVDGDIDRRTALSSEMGFCTRSVSLETVDEIGRNWAGGACFLVYDAGTAIEDCADLLSASDNASPIIAYRESADVDCVFSALDRGAAGYFEFSRGAGGVYEKVETLRLRSLRGQGRRYRRKAAARRLEVLSSRERQVLRAVAEGHSNKAIARQLSISPRTIEIHRRNVIAKLEVENSIGAVRVAVEGAL